MPPMYPYIRKTSSPQSNGLANWWPGLVRSIAGDMRVLDLAAGQHAIPTGTWAQVADLEVGEHWDSLGLDGIFPPGFHAPIPQIGASGLQSFTLTMWVKRLGANPVSSPHMWGKFVSGKWGYSVVTHTTGVTIQATAFMPSAAPAATVLGSPANVYDGDWHFVGAVFNRAATLNTWQDATELTNIGGSNDMVPIAHTSLSNSTRLGIGRRSPDHTSPNGNYFVGEVFDVRLYNRPLTPAEISAMVDPATRFDLFQEVSVMPELFSLVGNPVMPREGQEAIAALLDTTFTGAPPLLRLFQNDHLPLITTDVSDLVEADFDGYAEAALDVWISGFDETIQEAVLQAETKTFTMSGATTPNTVYGYYVVNAAGTSLLAAERFAAPIAMDEAGDAISVLAKLVAAARAAPA